MQIQNQINSIFNEAHSVVIDGKREVLLLQSICENINVMNEV